MFCIYIKKQLNMHHDVPVQIIVRLSQMSKLSLVKGRVHSVYNRTDTYNKT